MRTRRNNKEDCEQKQEQAKSQEDAGWWGREGMNRKNAGKGAVAGAAGGRGWGELKRAGWEGGREARAGGMEAGWRAGAGGRIKEMIYRSSMWKEDEDNAGGQFLKGWLRERDRGGRVGEGGASISGGNRWNIRTT